MTYKIERSTVHKEWNEISKLLHSHWDEIGLGSSENLTLDFDLEYYKAMENLDRYLGLTIKYNDELVGYIGFWINKHPHHKEIFSMTDGFYLKPEHRNQEGLTALSEAFAIAEGILKYQYNCKVVQFIYSVNNDLGKLGKRLGYQPSDVIMYKEV